LIANSLTRSFPLIYRINSGFLVKNLVINHHKREGGMQVAKREVSDGKRHGDVENGEVSVHDL
jgi:hypothetical protein